jgi:hypothetical protein
VGHSTHSFLAWLSWYGPTRVLQKALFRTPLVVVPTLIGEIEQDYLFWPLKYRAIARQWQESTEWGHLFDQYQQLKERSQGGTRHDRPLEPEAAR